VLLATIAATAVATTACKKTPKPRDDAPSPSATEAPPAPTDWTRTEMSEVHTTSPVDGIAIYADELDYQGKERSPTVMAEHGRRCSPDAGDEEACRKSMYRLIDEQQKAKRAVFALVTRGTTLEVITEVEPLRALLGVIDTPREAVLLASFATKSQLSSPQCTGFTRTIGVEQASGGYAMAMEKRVKNGTLKKGDAAVCTKCMILDKTAVTVRPGGEMVFGPTEQIEEIHMGCGRSPGFSGAATAPGRPRTSSEYLALGAHLEAASVAAFERIAEELVALGAPSELVTRARLAADDERAHAKVLGELARAHGAAPIPFTARPYQLRDALELALDNAVEGCVNETFGALVLHVQALTALDPEVKRGLASIAEDEARHAELSYDMADWLDGRLSSSARESVERASRDARHALLAGLEQTALEDDSERRRLGLPDAATARALYAELDRLTA
jgi:hypothetical protein